MEVISTLAVIAAIVFIGFFAEIIFKKTNIPDVLLLILVGIIIGTYLKWANADTFGEASSLFTTFALVFILFQGALSIDFKTLVKSLSSTVKLTISSFILTVLIVTGIAVLMNYDIMLAILIGTILAGTSSAVVIPLVSNVEIKNKYGLVLTLESAISDVLCIIGSITILEIIETGQVVASNIFQSILSSFSLALVVGTVFGIIWVILLSKVEIFTESYMLTVAFVIALYALVESSFVNASGAIAALAFGLVMGNSKGILTFQNGNNNNNKLENKEEKQPIIRSVVSSSAKNFYSEISFFVKTFFFVYLGILIDFSNPIIFVYGGLLTIGIFLIRPFAVRLAFLGQSIPENERTLLEVLIPKGLAAAVLAGVAVQSGVLSELAGVFVNTILSVIFLSIILTSVLVFLSQKEMFKGFLPFLHPKN